MYKHILVPTDGSDLAGKGVKQGLALAKALGAKVTVVTATEPFPVSGFALGAGWVPSGADMQEFNASQKEDAEKILLPSRRKQRRRGSMPISSMCLTSVPPMQFWKQPRRTRPILS